jgi:hypothetical protein
LLYFYVSISWYPNILFSTLMCTRFGLLRFGLSRLAGSRDAGLCRFREYHRIILTKGRLVCWYHIPMYCHHFLHLLLVCRDWISIHYRFGCKFRWVCLREQNQLKRLKIVLLFIFKNNSLLWVRWGSRYSYYWIWRLLIYIFHHMFIYEWYDVNLLGWMIWFLVRVSAVI